MNNTNDSVWGIPKRDSKRSRKTENARKSSSWDALSNAVGVLQPGETVLERFEIREQIGRGGMSLVYRAFDSIRQEDVALKFLSPALTSDSSATSNFLNEARISSRLSHPSILHVFEAHQHQGTYFLSMELLEGRNLREVIVARKELGKPFMVQEVLDYILPVCNALDYAHQSMLHRDVKPENIGLTKEGVVKLMDFGLAKLLHQKDGPTFRETISQVHVGTPYYIAPEQLQGHESSSKRSDQFSVAVIIYEMLTGQLPLGLARSLEVRRPDLPSGLTRAVDRALSTALESRFPDIDSFAEALKSGAEEREFMRRWIRINPVLVRSIQAVLASFVICGILWMSGQQWRRRLAEKHEEMGRSWKELREAEAGVNSLNVLAMETWNSMDILSRTLDLERSIWDKGNSYDGQYAILARLTNQVDRAREMRTWLKPRLSENQKFTELDEHLSLCVKALNRNDQSAYKISEDRLRESIDRIGLEFTTVEKLNALKAEKNSLFPAWLEVNKSLGLQEESAPLSKQEEFKKLDSKINEFIRDKKWTKAVPLLMSFNDDLKKDLTSLYETAVGDYEKNRKQWFDLFPEIGPPELKFLADPEGLSESSLQLQASNRFSQALDFLQRASTIYANWHAEVLQAHQAAAPYWNNTKNGLENDMGMRFIPIKGKYWGVWEVRVMDFARFIQLKGSNFQDADDFWMNPGYEQGPTYPVVGISKRMATIYARWLLHRWNDLPVGGVNMPSSEEWRAMWLASDEAKPILTGVLPSQYEWNQDHYATQYIDNRIDPKDHIRSTGLTSVNNLGLFGVSDNVWEWAVDDYTFGDGLSIGDTTTSMMFGGGSFGEVSYHEHELQTENSLFVLKKSAIGFRVVFSLNSSK